MRCWLREARGYSDCAWMVVEGLAAASATAKTWERSRKFGILTAPPPAPRAGGILTLEPLYTTLEGGFSCDEKAFTYAASLYFVSYSSQYIPIWHKSYCCGQKWVRM